MRRCRGAATLRPDRQRGNGARREARGMRRRTGAAALRLDRQRGHGARHEA